MSIIVFKNPVYRSLHQFINLNYHGTNVVVLGIAVVRDTDSCAAETGNKMVRVYYLMNDGKIDAFYNIGPSCCVGRPRREARALWENETGTGFDLKPIGREMQLTTDELIERAIRMVKSEFKDLENPTGAGLNAIQELLNYYADDELKAVAARGYSAKAPELEETLTPVRGY